MTIANLLEIPSLKVWLSTDAITPQADASLMPAAWDWPDQSDNGYTGIHDNGNQIIYRTASGRTGGPTFEFPGTGVPFWHIPAAALAGSTESEVWCVCKVATGLGGRGPVGDGVGWPHFMQYPQSPTSVRVAWNMASRVDFGALANDVFQWRRLNMWSKTGDFAIRTDEAHAGGSPYTGSTYSINGQAVGYDEGVADGNQGFKGMISAYALFSPRLTTAQRVDVAQWFTDHPGGGVRPVTPPVANPMAIPGCLIWCSAEAETTYANGAPVSSWHDLTGHGWHLTPGGNPPVFQTSGGPGASGKRIRFNGAVGQNFYVPNVAWSGKTALWVYMRVKADSQNSQRTLMNSGTGGGQSAHYAYSDGNIYEPFMNTVRRAYAASFGTAWHSYSVSSKAASWKAHLNGNAIATYATNTFQLPAGGTDFFLGGGYLQFLGDITTFCLFDHEPTRTEREGLEAWSLLNQSGGTIGPALPDVIVSGVKKSVVGASVIQGGVKKPVQHLWVVQGGVKKTVI